MHNADLQIPQPILEQILHLLFGDELPHPFNTLTLRIGITELFLALWSIGS